MTGWLAVVGLGPGSPDLLTPEAAAVLADATDLVGYGPYVDRVPARDGLRRHATDNREELDRARHALGMAGGGARVAVVSGGDAGVFGMASAVFEALEAGPPEWRGLDVRVVPGISAMLAAAARLGAPLGHDFCVLSLSDNLKPWALIEQRLRAAAGAGFVLALYNAASKARPDQLRQAFAVLRDILPARVPVAFATAITRPDERIVLTTLAAADAEEADMRTLVLIGTETSRLIPRPAGRSWLYAPRIGRRLAGALLFVVGAWILAGPALAQERLPALGADARRVSVSGLSSGGFMAVQYDVAFSASTTGVGVVAGGPYDCARVNPGGMMACTQGTPSGRASFDAARRLALAGQIDPVVNLAAHRVYLFSGTGDTVVRPPVVAAVRDQYLAAGVPASAIRLVDTMPAGHGYLSAFIGNACGDTEPPYIETCATASGPYDQPGAILAQLLGPLQPKATTLPAQPRAFDQREFRGAGFAPSGFVYIPRQCEGGTVACAVHVVFHGCRQSASEIGDAIYGRLGYNQWADSNGIVVLYPQVNRSTLPFNPEGCWDWWGYSGVGFQTRTGRQLRAVRAMVDRLTTR